MKKKSIINTFHIPDPIFKKRNEKYEIKDRTREFNVGVGFRASSKEYRENYDDIFRKQKE